VGGKETKHLAAAGGRVDVSSKEKAPHGNRGRCCARLRRCGCFNFVTTHTGYPFVTRACLLQLGALLRAVSALRPAQGYVQGMSFLGAILLEVMPVEEVCCSLRLRLSRRLLLSLPHSSYPPHAS